MTSKQFLPYSGVLCMSNDSKDTAYRSISIYDSMPDI